MLGRARGRGLGASFARSIRVAWAGVMRALRTRLGGFARSMSARGRSVGWTGIGCLGMGVRSVMCISARIGSALGRR